VCSHPLFHCVLADAVPPNQESGIKKLDGRQMKWFCIFKGWLVSRAGYHGRQEVRVQIV